MSNKSCFRVKKAAGAILAGAAIPIAAAGPAWADTTDANPTSDKVPSVQALQEDGLTTTEARDVVVAAKEFRPVAVSVDGVAVYSNEAAAKDGTTATSGAGTGDVAVAIGASAKATSNGGGGGKFDNAFARGTDASAQAGSNAGDSSDTATASGTRANALAGAGDNDTATDTASGKGNDPKTGGEAIAVQGSNNIADANGDDAVAKAQGGSNDDATGSGARVFVLASGTDDKLVVTGGGDAIIATGTDDYVDVVGGSLKTPNFITDTGDDNSVFAKGIGIGTPTSPVDVSKSGTPTAPIFVHVTPPDTVTVSPAPLP